MTAEPSVSIIMVNYNGKSDLASSLPLLLSQTYSNFEIIVVDNASTDDSVKFLRENFPQVRVIEAGSNLGFGAGNNRGVAQSNGEYIVFTNYDVVFDRDWIKYLVAGASSSSDIGLVAPKILLFDHPDQIQTVGLGLQYTGHAFASNLRMPACDFMDPVELPCVSGCAFLIKRSVIENIGGFDETYHKLDSEWFHSSLEDVDLSWRARLAGYRIVFEPRAIMYHKYIPKPMTLLRFKYLERGRHYTLLKNYKYTSLVAMLPALALAEIITIGYSVLKGRSYLLSKFNSYKWLLDAAAPIADGHRQSQSRRVVPDSQIAGLFLHGTELRHATFPAWLTEVSTVVINAAFEVLYWQFQTTSKMMFRADKDLAAARAGKERAR